MEVTAGLLRPFRLLLLARAGAYYDSTLLTNADKHSTLTHLRNLPNPLAPKKPRDNRVVTRTRDLNHSVRPWPVSNLNLAFYSTHSHSDA